MSTELKIDLDAPPDPAVLERTKAWTRDLRPRNDLESFLVAQAAELSIDLERNARVAAARTAHQARIGPGKEVSEAEALAIQIGQELLAQVAYDALARRFDSQHRDAAKSAPPPAPPELCVHRLKASAEGCRWLITKWVELDEIFDERLLWGPEDERLAILLLGKTPDLEDNAEIRELRLASSVMTGIKPQHVASLTEENVGRPVPSREQARDHVRVICRRNIDRLRALASVREETLRMDAELDRLRFAFDGTDDGKELERRQSTRRRELLKMIETLTKLQKQPLATDDPTEQTEVLPGKLRE